MKKTHRCTIVTLAEELGVSPSTISRAFDPASRISDEVRKTILERARLQGYIPNRAAARLSMKEIRIAIALSDSYLPGVKETLRGLADAFYSLYDYKLNVSTFLFHCKQQSFREIHTMVETLRDFDGVILSGINSPEGMVVLNEFAETMPALVILQSDLPIPKLFTSAHDPAYSAKMAAEFLACCLSRSPHKRVALFTGLQETVVHAVAAQTFTRSARELGLDVISVQDMQENPELLRRQAEELLRSPTPPDGIYITSGNSLTLCELVQKADPQPMLVTFDTYPELNAYLLNGTVKATIYQNYYTQAFEAFTRLTLYLVDGQVPPKAFSPRPELVLPSMLPFYNPPEQQNSQEILNLQYITSKE